MKIIVDTAVWSLAFRRQPGNPKYKDVLTDLIADGRVVLLGAVRQEILSGLRHNEQFERLRLSLQAFPDLAVNIEDYELAAHYFKLCRAKGVQGATTDFLICSAAVNHTCEILTTDKDFDRFSELLPITLHSLGSWLEPVKTPPPTRPTRMLD